MLDTRLNLLEYLKLVILLQILIAAPVELQGLVWRRVGDLEADVFGEQARVSEHRVEDEELCRSISPLLEADNGHRVSLVLEVNRRDVCASDLLLGICDGRLKVFLNVRHHVRLGRTWLGGRVPECAYVAAGCSLVLSSYAPVPCHAGVTQNIRDVENGECGLCLGCSYVFTRALNTAGLDSALRVDALVPGSLDVFLDSEDAWYLAAEVLGPKGLCTYDPGSKHLYVSVAAEPTLSLQLGYVFDLRVAQVGILSGRILRKKLFENRYDTWRLV
jgi:hypothetical protein